MRRIIQKFFCLYGTLIFVLPYLENGITKVFMNDPEQFKQESLIKLSHAKMPFGKYQGRYLSDLPDAYLVWFKQKGFPSGELGRMLMEVLEIKLNGLESLLRDIRKRFPKG